MALAFKYEAAISVTISIFSLVSILSHHGPSAGVGYAAPFTGSVPIVNATLYNLLRGESRKSLKFQLQEQLHRIQELEVLYSTAYSKRREEEQGIAKLKQQVQQLERDKDWAKRKKEEHNWFRGRAEGERNAILSDLEGAVYWDSVAMGNFIQANRQQLQATWEARLAGQRQRGIVVSGGGPGPMTNAFVSLYVLRHHLKCTLPVIIMYWGAEGDVIKEKEQKVFKEHLTDVDFMDASKVPYPNYHRPLAPRKPDGTFVGWKVKVFALYAAPFKEVLFLDSDSIPVLDPTDLFEEEQYKKHGNLYWPDVYDKDTHNKHTTKRLFTVLRVENPWERPSPPRQAEAGQFLVNKEKHWDIMEWILFLNTHTEIVYRLFWGDKDTHRLAFHLAGKARSYMQVAQPPAFLMHGSGTQACLQLHPNGAVMFSHHTSIKYDLRQRGRFPTVTHITAQVSADLGTHIVFNGLPKVDYVTPDKCKYTLLNLPADQKACAPKYNPNKPGLDQRLPMFEYLPDSHIARAEEAGYQGFVKLQEALRQ